MLPDDWIGLGLFYGYFVVTGLPAVLLKIYFKLPFEVVRKMLHMIITCSIFLLLKLFSAWYIAALVAFSLVVVTYPLLAMVEHSALYQRIMVERKGGEFKSSLIIVQLSFITLIYVCWGLLGDAWKYVIVVAVMAWGLGDAAAALVGKAIGRRRIQHRWIEGAKTYEGTLAMFTVAGLAIFFTLFVYAGQSWLASLLAAVIVAPISALVELFSRRGSDTITVPLAVASTILPLMALFSFLGI